MKRIRTTDDLRMIAGDVDSVSFLLARLNEFLAGVIQQPPSDLLDVHQLVNAVSQEFLSLEKIWSAMPGFSLDKVKDLDPAEKFAVDFFHPLLDSDSLRDVLESGSPSFAADRPSFTQSMVQAYAPFFTRLKEILADRGYPQDQMNLVLGAVIGIVALCSFPLWVVYHHFHGYATYDRVMPRLLNSLSAARSVLTDVCLTFLSAPSWQTADFGLVLSQLEVSLRQALIQKAGPYIKAFEENAEAVVRLRIKLKERDLNTEVKSLQFWRHESGGKTSISLARTPPDPNADKALPYLGGIYFNATDADEQKRSFWALPAGWEALERATRFVSQAGFWLYVNAANNPYGGRHPPHQTHREGGDFDLGWTYLSTTWEIDENCVLGDPIGPKIVPEDKCRNRWHRENLARMKKVKSPWTDPVIRSILGYSPIFIDPATNEEYRLVPNDPQGGLAVSDLGLCSPTIHLWWYPPTHKQIQKLAAHVVLQAVALSGLKRYLYADAQNMRYAAENLGLAMSYLARKRGVTDPQLDPWASTEKKAVIPFTEAIIHYNHIHAELFARGTSDPGPLLKTEEGLTAVLTFLYELALERDNDEGFFDDMFRPRSGVEKDESEARIKPFRDFWKKRSSCGMPSLLPVWLTKERRHQLHQFMGS